MPAKGNLVYTYIFLEIDQSVERNMQEIRVAGLQQLLYYGGKTGSHHRGITRFTDDTSCRNGDKV